MPKRRYGTKAHNIRIPDELWQAMQEKAARRGTSVSAEIVKWAQGWVRKP